MLEERLLRRLNPLHFVVAQAVTGRVGGQQRSRRTGLSLDFAEHRPYLPGDDFRTIDWNLYGRLDRLFVKVFFREEDFPVYLLCDRSASMRLGGKLERVRQLAAALGYVALKDHNRLGVFPLSDALELGASWRLRSGWKRTLELFTYLQALRPARATDLDRALGQFAALGLPRGLVLVLSDMFCESGYAEGLTALRGAGFSVQVLHVLAPQDLDPRPGREVWLTSPEAPRQRRLGGPEAAQGYRRAVARYCQRLQALCHRHEIGYVRLPTALTLEETVLEHLRGRVLR